MTPKEKVDALVFKCDEAACKEDRRFYEVFDEDERRRILFAVLQARCGRYFLPSRRDRQRVH